MPRIVLGYPSGQGGNWEWELQIHLQNRAEFCEEESFGWKIHDLEASLTCKDDNSFRNGSVDECYSLKASQLAKFILVVTNTSDVEKNQESSWTELWSWGEQQAIRHIGYYNILTWLRCFQEKCLFSTSTNPIIHLFYPLKICIGIVLDYSWDMFMSQEKLQTMSMQNFWGVKEVHYGIVQVMNIWRWFWELREKRHLKFTILTRKPRGHVNNRTDA